MLIKIYMTPPPKPLNEISKNRMNKTFPSHFTLVTLVCTYLYAETYIVPRIAVRCSVNNFRMSQQIMQQ